MFSYNGKSMLSSVALHQNCLLFSTRIYIFLYQRLLKKLHDMKPFSCMHIFNTSPQYGDNSNLIGFLIHTKLPSWNFFFKVYLKA